MKIERTRDMELVERIVRAPTIWPHIHEDGTPDDWAPVDSESMHWMLITLSDGDIGGVFLVHPQNSVCFEMHTAVLPCALGAPAKIAAKLLLRWAFTELSCMKIVTHIPEYNRAALRYALAGGMVREGINRKSFLRDGKLIDQVMLGITKEEWELCQ